PILSENCFFCHGQDANHRKSDLRLDLRASALQPGKSGEIPIVPGETASSALVRRIFSSDPDEQMPPPKSNRVLMQAQKETLKRWIAEGAEYKMHWAFIAPVRPPLPMVRQPDWPRNGIDHFVLAKLEQESLPPSQEAERTTLIRRVSLDLTGLPPTPAELDSFLNDPSPEAYEKVVNRLLASPRYGERMAIRWLEAARYADTSGYQTDGERTMWRWRDWVIDAFNRNLPFDQFTIEQLAGDLLPGATLAQRIATGFNRNHRGNAEGGIIPEEYAVEYVVDRVDTTATVWLGLTLGCARCHDHKYDPITQREFYQVFAFFNNVPEKGRAVKIGNSPPYLITPTDEQAEQLAALDKELAAAEDCLRKLKPEIRVAQAAWEKSLAASQTLQWAPAAGLQAHFKFDGDLTSSERVLKMGSAGVSPASAGVPPTGTAVHPAVKTPSSLPGTVVLVPTGVLHNGTGESLELPKESGGGTNTAKFQDGVAAFAPGLLGQAAEFDGKRFINAGDLGGFGFFDKFSVSAWFHLTDEQGGSIVTRGLDLPEEEGYGLHVVNGRLAAYFTKRWLDDAMRVATEITLPTGRWHHVTMTYDGSRLASGVAFYVNGKVEKTHVLLDELNQTFATKEPLRIGAGGGAGARFHGLIDEVRVYGRVLSGEEAEALSVAEPLRDLATLPVSQRTPQQNAKLRLAFLHEHAPDSMREAYRQLLSKRSARAKFIESLPTTMVMEELPTPRDTFVLKRGEYNRPGDKVEPGLPAVFPSLPADAPRNRLDFAKWLVHPSNPLTARVAVNHAWQTFFGAGLVRTVEDFGAQGELPTHPELLDWLATEFIRTGWDVKQMHKLIVTSATYRQSSHVPLALLQRDPDNRLVARAPRPRLPAEMIRDQALFVSGLLVEKVGGPSVMPYQPPGLWKELSGTDYVQDHGEKLWRRSLYTFWKRTSAPPTMMTFDAAGRESCNVRQTRTSTPLQALALMNEVTFVEAARVLAQRIMTTGGDTPEQRISFAFRLATSRAPKAEELSVLLASWNEYQSRYQNDSSAAAKLVSTGEAPRNEQLAIPELAAYTSVANLILNLDETITRP
ncbi:MAG: DUF1553 domain-containing protein, partial [Verrucomicrobiales bacterium]|nr:DUF1553 domain-containing protein [Verrucomicrobiales bacterium]